MIEIWILSTFLLIFSALIFATIAVRRTENRYVMGSLAMTYIGMGGLNYSIETFSSEKALTWNFSVFSSIFIWSTFSGFAGALFFREIKPKKFFHFLLVSLLIFIPVSSYFIYFYTDLVFIVVYVLFLVTYFVVSFKFAIISKFENLELKRIGQIFLIRTCFECLSFFYNLYDPKFVYLSPIFLIPNLFDLWIAYLLLLRGSYVKVAELVVSGKILAQYFESHPEAMLLVSKDGRILESNSFGKELLGMENEEKQSYYWIDFLSKKPDKDTLFFESTILSNRERFEIELKKQNGNPFWAEVAINQPIRRNSDRFILFIRDITEYKFQEEMLHFQAWHDSLTGLVNRKRMTEILGSKIKQGTAGYLCFWDLKNFERLNRDYSHNVGDKVIIGTSLKLHSLLPSNSILSRFGSDQFLVFLEGITAEQCLDYISNTQLLFDIPFVIGDLILHLGVATGIAKVVPGNHLSDILFQTESALKEAKKSESSHFYFFEESLLRKIELESRIFSRLPEALAKGEFSHFFQPIFANDSKEVVGVEALVRWKEPSQGFIPPDQFIPFAEKTGFILSLGSHLFEKACKTLGHWRKLGFKGKLSINLSPFQIPYEFTAEYLLAVLNQNDLTGADIELELTERFLIQEGKALTDWFLAISAIGVSLSLDDFGTGYSSLSYLKSFPVQKLKMDKSFIQNIDSDLGKQALVSAILGLAEAFGMRTTAEGVEHKKEMQYLSKLPIDFLQGYYFSRPVPEEDFPSFFSKGN